MDYSGKSHNWNHEIVLLSPPKKLGFPIRLAVILSFLVTILASSHVAAELYKCVDEETGLTTLTDTGCEKNQSGVLVEAPEDYSPRPPESQSHYQFPDSKKKYSTVQGGSDRCDLVQQETKYSRELIALQEKLKEQDAYERVDTHSQIKQLKFDYDLLKDGCPNVSR